MSYWYAWILMALPTLIQMDNYLTVPIYISIGKALMTSGHIRLIRNCFMILIMQDLLLRISVAFAI